MTSLASTHESGLAGIDTADAFRVAFSRLPDENCRAGIFETCLRPIIYSRHHWLVFKGEYRVRADLRSVLESMRSRGPSEWDDEEADFLLSLYALDSSSVGLDELRDRADSATVRDVLRERHALYAQAAGSPEAAPTALLDLARRVDELRGIVQESHLLYSIIDGRAWYRTEGVIPRGDVDAATLTPSVEEMLDAEFGPAIGSAADRLRAATRAAVAAEGHSAPLVRGIMWAALTDPVLRADHVTLTCPIGDMLDRPQDMTTSEAFFTETQLRDGVDLGEYAERLGHESSEQLQRTIKARMLKLKRGAIRTLYGPGCLQGRFVEKHGGHMLFRNEDAHYRGHQSIGCHSGGRASFAMRYRRGETERELTPMVGDFRVVRMSHDERDIFNADELRHVIRYGEWFGIVVEETYRLGAVVRIDAAPPPRVDGADLAPR